jgi:hypothetical protein
METPKRLVPYSVYLSEEVYEKVKAAAKDRKAATMVRDAINLFIQDKKPYTAGYNKALKDAMGVIRKHEGASSIHIGGKSVSKALCESIDKLKITKEVPDAKKET